MNSITSLKMTPNVVRIFCYGDSLTHGSSPPSFSSFPYGPHLERELNQSIDDNTAVEVMVRWRGLPGWTAVSMAQNLHDPKFGLVSAIHGISNPPLSLVVILAGTNDIGTLTCGGGGGSRNEGNNANAIIDPIIQLHRACLDFCADGDCNKLIRTIALGIPGSAWQKQNPTALKLCMEVNNGLRHFASMEDRVIYVDFPLPYDGEDEWNVDGLHMSERGYEALGTALAPYVKEIILGGSGTTTTTTIEKTETTGYN
jgi:lysophospholipase L1-like esterase